MGEGEAIDVTVQLILFINFHGGKMAVQRLYGATPPVPFSRARRSPSASWREPPC